MTRTIPRDHGLIHYQIIYAIRMLSAIGDDADDDLNIRYLTTRSILSNKGRRVLLACPRQTPASLILVFHLAMTARLRTTSYAFIALINLCPSPRRSAENSFNTYLTYLVTSQSS